MEDACEAAHRSYEKLRDLGVSARRKAVNVIRKMCVANAKPWGEIEFAETKIGRLDHNGVSRHELSPSFLYLGGCALNRFVVHLLQ